MTDTELQIAIAESQRWKFHQGDEPIGLPDLLNDANAIDDVIRGLPEGEHKSYCAILGSLIHEDDFDEWKFQCLTATPRQKCIAVAKTLGLWKKEAL